MPCSHSYFESDGHYYCTKCGRREYGPGYSHRPRRRKSRGKRAAGIVIALLAVAAPIYWLAGGDIDRVEPLAYEAYHMAKDLSYEAYFILNDMAYEAYYAVSDAEPPSPAEIRPASPAPIPVIIPERPAADRDVGPKTDIISRAIEPIQPAIITARDTLVNPAINTARDTLVKSASYVMGDYSHIVPIDYSDGHHHFRYAIGELGGLSVQEAQAAAGMAERAWEESGSSVSFERVELAKGQSPAEAEIAFVIDYVPRNTAKVSDLGDHAGYFSCFFDDAAPYNRYVKTCQIFAYVEDLACNGKWMKVSTRSLGGTIEHEIGHFLLTSKMSHHPSEDHLMYGDVDYTEYPFDPRGLVIPKNIAQFLEYEELEGVQAESDRLGPVIDDLEAAYDAQVAEYDGYTDGRIIYEGSAEAAKAKGLYDALEQTRITLNSAIDERNGLIDLLSDAYRC